MSEHNRISNTGILRINCKGHTEVIQTLQKITARSPGDLEHVGDKLCNTKGHSRKLPDIQRPQRN